MTCVIRLATARELSADERIWYARWRAVEERDEWRAHYRRFEDAMRSILSKDAHVLAATDPRGYIRDLIGTYRSLYAKGATS